MVVMLFIILLVNHIVEGGSEIVQIYRGLNILLRPVGN